MICYEGVNNFIECCPFQHLIKLMQCQIDAVVSHPALRKIVRPNALRAVTRADLVAALLGTFARYLFALEFTSR